MNIATPAGINAMLRATPGAVVVQKGGVSGYGHFANVPTQFGDDGAVLVSEPAVVIASGYFPDICLDDADGKAAGIDEDIAVGNYVWRVRAIEPGEAPGEMRCFLTNRQGNTDG